MELAIDETVLPIPAGMSCPICFELMGEKQDPVATVDGFLSPEVTPHHHIVALPSSSSSLPLCGQEAEHLVRKARDAEETMLPGGDICVKPSREASLRRARQLAGSDGVQNQKGWWCALAPPRGMAPGVN